MQGCTVADALDTCEAWPRLFDAAFTAPEKPGGKRRLESSKAYAERLRAEREAMRNGGRARR